MLNKLKWWNVKDKLLFLEMFLFPVHVSHQSLTAFNVTIHYVYIFKYSKLKTWNSLEMYLFKDLPYMYNVIFFKSSCLWPTCLTKSQNCCHQRRKITIIFSSKKHKITASLICSKKHKLMIIIGGCFVQCTATCALGNWLETEQNRARENPKNDLIPQNIKQYELFYKAQA